MSRYINRTPHKRMPNQLKISINKPFLKYLDYTDLWHYFRLLPSVGSYQ